ncbi:MAG: hypothetical protein LBQ42_00915 [Synergistaceae bacterium]|jgi:hypothetical protein|nr:hypothetical protein [Synergistaceae bacterium]
MEKFPLDLVYPRPSRGHEDKRFIHHNGNGTFTFSEDTVDSKHLTTRYPLYTK